MLEIYVINVLYLIEFSDTHANSYIGKGIINNKIISLFIKRKQEAKLLSTLPTWLLLLSLSK